MERKFTGAQVEELHRLAYHPSPIVDTAKALAASGIPPDLVPIKTAARLCHVTCTQIRKRIRRGDITAYRASGWRILIPLSAVIEVATPRPLINSSASQNPDSNPSR